MEAIAEHVKSVLQILAKSRGVEDVTLTSDIIRDSLDRMRFIVAMEERCDVFIDDERIEDLRFDTVDALVESFYSIVEMED